MKERKKAEKHVEIHWLPEHLAAYMELSKIPSNYACHQENLHKFGQWLGQLKINTIHTCAYHRIKYLFNMQ